MPFLCLSNPRNRATAIALLLVIEFMAILWFRDPGLGQGGSRRRAAAIFSPGSSHDRSHVQDDLQHRQNLQYQQQKEHPQMTHEDFLKLRRVERGDSTKESVLAKGKELKDNESSNPVVQNPIEPALRQQHQDQHYRQRHHHHHRPAEVRGRVGTAKEQQGQKQRANDQVAVTATVTNTKTEGSAVELGTTLDQAPNALPDPKEDKIVKSVPRVSNNKSGTPAKSSHANKKNKAATAKAASKSKLTSKQSQQERRQQQSKGKDRNAFKSTEERKRAQLIPALDESGTVIEDHFISPRDTDGDGIPDTFVLLRPSGNPKYMMDVGLFDDEIAMAPLPKGPPTPVLSASSPIPSPTTLSPTVGKVSSPVVGAVVDSSSTPPGNPPSSGAL
ncbi:hypothetical protein BGW38_000011 [Lunasporangiospora selenospora]|uniref:Uncharacterized protein n=1 Tax=Lunasporangiospora selenospora TaxID=979761 RepID=A0A9P6G5V7_9FUNG|nr:hypothetical protein BGW38_000011 [Lunasporangiospora selenospora]